MPRWYRTWRAFWRPPDDMLVAAGASGERAVARIRVLVTGILVVIPLARLAMGESLAEAGIGVAIAGGALFLALGFLVLAQGEGYHPWLGFATSVTDVTLISVTLTLFVATGAPHAAVNSPVVFLVYFLALAATALRYDPRTSAVAGIVAVGEYLAIVGYAANRWDLNDPIYAPYSYGTFSWSAQVARAVLVAGAALFAVLIVVRTQRLRWLSASDPLTQTMSRGFFDERMEEEEVRSRRYDRPLAIAMIDIDHFKEFNDTYGHASGDEALRVTSRAIRSCVRRTDLVARYGGEEFVVAFLETHEEAAVRKAEDIRRTVEAQRVLLKGGKGVSSLTVSVGVATWPEDGDTIRAVLEKADARLYTAKQAGRNRAAGPAGIVTPAGADGS